MLARGSALGSSSVPLGAPTLWLPMDGDRRDFVEYGLWALCRLPPGELIFILNLLEWIVEGPEEFCRNYFPDVEDARVFFGHCFEEVIQFDRRLPAGGLLLRPPHGGYRQPGNWQSGVHGGKGMGMGKGASLMTGKGRGKGDRLPVAEKGRGKGHPRGSRSRSRSRQRPPG